MTITDPVPPVLTLPEVPADQENAPVAAWRSRVMIETYAPQEPDRYPAFLDQRVYQGSSGAVYPLPFHDRVSAERAPRAWDAILLENAWLKIMILPELGGRIHVALDKRTGYDLFYRNPVIKPALVGLAGPWIAGGVEFNWPQHHRPATYLPTEATIEHEPDGAVTVWCSDHDPFTRMKGMHGVRLYPDRAVIELRVRLFNRSDEPQTFLWWANVAAESHADYQSFFPSDVRFVADHAKRAVSTFPAAEGAYYGVDYPARVGLDTHQGSDLVVPGDRLDWYRNISVPTSYMVLGTRGEFFGGYDHRAGAGFVHVADRQYSVGKKQWTWGNADFGRAWDANLSDTGSAYVELMAGVFTDNQPDFSFIAPGETKTFTQTWYGIAGTGPVQQAGVDAAASVTPTGDGVRVAINATRELLGSTVTLRSADRVVWTTTVDLGPDQGLEHTVAGAVGEHSGDLDLGLSITTDGVEVLRWVSPVADTPVTPPDAATEPLSPAEIVSVDELHLTGVHLSQYRHATRSPEPYWEEALARDPGHVGANTALAARRHAEGRFAEAETLLRSALARQTARNPNPGDGEPSYRLGLALERLGRDEEAYDAFGKATWNRAWRGAGGLAMARIDARHGRDRAALHRLDDTLAVEPDHLQARAAKIIVLRRLGRNASAAALVESTLALDPLDAWTLHVAGFDRCTLDAQVHLDLALEYASIGADAEALLLLATAVEQDRRRPVGQTACGPTARYLAAWIHDRAGDHEAAARDRAAARELDPAWVFPNRLDELQALEAAVVAAPDDGQASALVGLWFYAHRRPADAIAAWRRASVLLDDAVVWRDLGVALYNHPDEVSADDGDRTRQATAAYEKALALAPDDGRLWSERDQLARRTGEALDTRWARLDAHPDAVSSRDDLCVAYAQLLVDLGRPDDAVARLADRRFQPWEGGEGVVLRAWERAHLLLARTAVATGRTADAVVAARAAVETPPTLGEARHLLANPAELMLTLGDALAADGDHQAARGCWTEAAAAVGDFQAMATHAYSENSYFSILAAIRLDDHDRAGRLTEGLRAHTEALAGTPAVIDYFATSLPTLLLFTADPQDARDRTVTILRAQLSALDGHTDRAVAQLRGLLVQDPADETALDLLSMLSATPVSTTKKDDSP